MDHQSDHDKRQFDQLFTHALAGVALIDEEGKLLGANHAFTTAFGLEESTIKGMTLPSLLGPSHHQTDSATEEDEDGPLFDHYATRRWINKDGSCVEINMVFSEVQFDFFPQVSMLALITEIKEVALAEMEC